MKKTSITVYAKDSAGNSLNLTVSNINPEISDDIITSFAAKIIALTDNLYTNTVRNDTVQSNLD